MQQYSPQKPFSLKQKVRERFSRAFSSVLLKSKTNEIVLVLDSYCTSLISNLFTMTQLIGFKFTIVEKLEIKRRKFPELPVLYFIEPRQKSIKYMIDDFEEQLSYARIHILFPYKCPKDILNQISLNAAVIKKIRSIKEFYHSNFFLGDNVVTFKQDYLQVAYSEYNSNRQKNTRSRISSKFIEIFRSIGEFFQVNLHYKKSTSGVAERMAEAIEENFKQFIRELIVGKESVVNENAETIDVLILDRSIDPVTPLLHDLFYESMLFDLMDFEEVHLLTKEEKEIIKQRNEKRKKEKEEKQKQLEQQKAKEKLKIDKEETKQKQEQKPREKSKEKKKKKKHKASQQATQELQEQILPQGLNQVNDPAYQKYRYEHIANVLQELPRDIVELSNKVKYATTENLMQIDIGLSKKYQIQMLLVRQCQRIFEQKKLADIGQLQQALATGIDINGQQTSSVKLIDQVKQLIQSEHLTQPDKLRLALISYCCISFSQKDYKKLIKMLPQQQHKIFVRMVWLGVSLKMETKRSTKNIKQNIRKIALEKLQKHNMNLSRYSSIIQLILPIIGQGLISNIKIDTDIFGSIVIQQNPKKKQIEVENKKQTRKREKIVASQPKGKKTMIVLFVGGGSFAEIRAIKNLEINQKLNIIIAADMFMTPEEYVDAISNMKQPN